MWKCSVGRQADLHLEKLYRAKKTRTRYDRRCPRPTNHCVEEMKQQSKSAVFLLLFSLGVTWRTFCTVSRFAVAEFSCAYFPKPTCVYSLFLCCSVFYGSVCFVLHGFCWNGEQQTLQPTSLCVTRVTWDGEFPGRATWQFAWTLADASRIRVLVLPKQTRVSFLFDATWIDSKILDAS